MFSGNGSEAYRTIIEYSVPFVSFNRSNQSYFPSIQQYICYFLFQKAKKQIKTTIETSDANTIHLDLEDRPVNPIRDWTTQNEKRIRQLVSNERNAVIYNRGRPISEYRGNRYAVVYTPTKLLHTNNTQLATGLHQKKAILFGMSTDLAFKMDYSGSLGAGPNTFIIPFHTHSEGKRLEQFLKSDEYRALALATKTTRQYLKLAFIEHLKLTNIIQRNNKTRNNKTRNNKTRNNKTRKNKY